MIDDHNIVLRPGPVAHHYHRAVAGVFQGMLLFFLLATDVLVRYRIRWDRRSTIEEAG